MRVRQLIIYGKDEKQQVVPDSYSRKLQRLQDGALDLFRRLVTRTFLPTAIKAAQRAEQKAAKIIPENGDEEQTEEKKTDADDIDDGKDDEKAFDEIDDNEDDEAGLGGLGAPPKPGLLRQKTTEMQEDMVGILAMVGEQGNTQKIGSLQRLVFELIFSEIKKEMKKAETLQRTFYDLDYDDPDIPPDERIKLKKEKSRACISDNYCFEMFCMILDLTSAKSGQRFIASPLLASTLFQIFPRASTRMQDALISIFSNIFQYIKPNVIRQINYHDDSDPPRKYNVNLVDFFLYCIASSLQVQLRGNENGKKYSKDLKLYGWINPLEPEQCKYVVKMLRNILTQNGGTTIWKQIIKQRLIDHVLKTSKLQQDKLKADTVTDEEQKESQIPVFDQFWLIVASLCVIAGDTGEKALSILNFDSSSEYAVDFRQGNATIKVLVNNYPVIILTADLIQCKSVITFKKAKSDKAQCRFCDRVLTEKTRAAYTGDDEKLSKVDTLKDVCNDDFCIDSARAVCQKRLPCGHLCCGIHNESVCLPCLDADCEGHIEAEMKEDRDTYCNICYTDTLAAQPTILLTSCKHAFHYQCVYKMLELRWNGPRITFGFRGCPLCKKDMRHEGLDKLNEPLDKLYESVKAKSLMRLQYEKLDTHPDIVNENGRFYNDVAGFAMNKYAYYMCYKCQQPYYGGEAVCAAAVGAKNFDPSELLCPSCSPIRVEDCPRHGKDYIEFKCRYCCTIAVWFCFGTTHFCEPCHNNISALNAIKKEDRPQCPCKPKDRYSTPEALKDVKGCPLGLKHPVSGEEFCLGCGLCRNKDF